MKDTPPKEPKAKRPRRRGWRIFFSIFKWCRVGLLLAILCLVLALIFLHQAGLPVSMQENLVEQFRQEGWDAQFTRLRLRWYRGVVAEQFSLSRTNEIDGPHLFVETAEFRLNPKALRELRLQADSVLLSEARLIWPLSSTNRPRHTFDLQAIHGELIFHPNESWELRSLEGRTLGFQVRARGLLTNALQVRHWKFPRPDLETTRGPRGELWAELMAIGKQIHPAGPPQLNIQFTGDGRDPRSLGGTVKIIAPALESPWCAGTNFNLTAQLHPAPSTNSPMLAELKISAEAPRTPWGTATHLLLSVRWEPSFTQPWPTNSQFTLDLRQPRSDWGNAERLHLAAQTVAATDASMETSLVLDLEQPRTRSGRALHVHLAGQAVHPPDRVLPARWQLVGELNQAATAQATSTWTRVEGALALPARAQLQVFRTNATWPERWTNIEATLTCLFSNALAPEFAFSQVTLTNHWHASVLHAGVVADSPSGVVAFNATLDTTSREARINATMRADPHQFTRLLPTNAQVWLADYRSPIPLELQAAGRVTLPPWTNAVPDWPREVWPTMSIAGRVETGTGTFRRVEFTGLRAIGMYTNGQWTLPEVRVSRPEGAVEAEAFANTDTADFRVKVTSTIFPHALRPAFDERVQQRAFDLFALTRPPFIRGEVRGNWRDGSTLGAIADAAVSNAAVRTQAVGFATAHAEFTNGFLSLIRPLILREGQRGEADGIGFDTVTKRLYLTNAHGNLDPMALAHALGPQIVRVLEPYVFDTPPEIRAHGLLPLRHGDNGEDAWFSVEGGPFHWWRLHADKVRSQIHWLGESKTVTLTNLAARWRGSDAAGWMHLDFTRPKGGAMAFHIGLEGASLSGVVQDLQNGRTNRLEGTFGGALDVTEAFLDDWQSWQGHGRADLREGLLWDIPLFAVLSPLLNAVLPGLGHSRAREGRATFTITNSVIHSRDLQIRASAMQLRYRGTIDFHGGLDARMEAELFRNVPGLGIVLSKVLWPVTKLFEYRVTGTLDNPKLDEKYFIPKIVLFPLQPIKTLKDLFVPDKDKAPDKPPAPPPPEPAPPK